MASIEKGAIVNIIDRLRSSVANRSDDVFLRRDFERSGSPVQVTRALATLTRKGMLGRLG